MPAIDTFRRLLLNPTQAPPTPTPTPAPTPSPTPMECTCFSAQMLTESPKKRCFRDRSVDGSEQKIVFVLLDQP